MEDGGHYGNSAVHKGGRGDGDQGRTEGKGEFRVFKVGLIEIEIIYSAIYEAFALVIYLKSSGNSIFTGRARHFTVDQEL